MAAGEIAAAVTGIRAPLDITKAMVGLRDAETFRAKSIELQGVVLEAFNKANRLGCCCRACGGLFTIQSETQMTP